MTQIRIKYINNDGNGFADYVNIESGTTVSQFLASKNLSSTALQVTVNREAVATDYVLVAEDRISVTPKKIAGAAVLVQVNGGELEPKFAGGSVLELFRTFLGNGDPKDYLIQVDGAPTTPDERPRDGQIVKFTKRVGGAAAAPVAVAPAAPVAAEEPEWNVTVKGTFLVKDRVLDVTVRAANLEQAIAKAKALQSFEATYDSTQTDSDDNSTLDGAIVTRYGAITVEGAEQV